VRRLPGRHDRRHVSIFGELTIDRVAYGTREGPRIEHGPRDQRPGLPEGDFSSVLEDRGQRLCLKGSFAEAGQSLEMLLGLKIGARALEPRNEVVAGHARSFQASLEPPPPGEEGPLMVVTADGKGGPMRRPEPEDGPRPPHRRTEGEKADTKRRAGVGAVYSIEPFVRKADDIIDEVLRDKKAQHRPEPQHKHAWAEMTREVEGPPPVTATEGLFCRLTDELAARDLGHDRPVIWLLDGARALWDAQAVYFPEARRGAGPVPRARAAPGGGALLPQGGQRRGQGVGGAAAAGPAPGPGGVRDRRPAAAARGREAERPGSPGGPLGAAIPGGQQGAHAVRRVPGGGRPDRQRGGGGGVPPPGQGPDQADRDALGGGGGAGDAPGPGPLPRRPVGGVPRAPCGAGASPAVHKTCGLGVCPSIAFGL